MSHGDGKRKIQGATAHKLEGPMSALAFQLTQHEYTQRLTGKLRLAVSNERMPVKRLAEMAQSSVATAKNWYEQRNPPEGLYLARLLSVVPEFQAEYRRITSMEADLDPELGRELNNLLLSYQRMREREKGVP